MSARRCRKSIYFLRLEIENVRCFAEKQVLDLVDSDNRPARWNLIVGDNGVGKTTLLQCLSWMRPAPYFDPGTAKQTGIQPWLLDQDTSDLERLLRDGASPTALRAEMVEIPTMDSHRPSTPRIITGITLDAEDNELAAVRRTENETEKTVEPFVIPYAANRHMGHQNAYKLSKAEPDDLLQTDSTELVDAADVLSRLDYSDLKGNAESYEMRVGRYSSFHQCGQRHRHPRPGRVWRSAQISNPVRECPAEWAESRPPHCHGVDHRSGLETGQSVSGESEAA